MHLTICKRILPGAEVGIWQLAKEEPAICPEEILTKDELACWFYLTTQSNLLGKGHVSPKEILQAFGYSGTSASHPDIVNWLKATLCSTMERAKKSTAGAITFDPKELNECTASKDFHYTVDYSPSRDARFGFVSINENEADRLLHCCHGTGFKLPDMLNTYLAILASLHSKANGVGAWRLTPILTALCGMSEKTFYKYRQKLADAQLIYFRAAADHPTYYAREDKEELWKEIAISDKRQNAPQGVKTYKHPKRY